MDDYGYPLIVPISAECTLPMDPLLLGVFMGCAAVLAVTVLFILFQDFFK